MRRRGALLMELMLSLAIFATAGLAILALVRQSMGNLEHSRHMRRAVDIARSTMSRIEAGLDDPATLDGPLALWDGRAALMSASDFDGFGGAPIVNTDIDPNWELEVTSLPSQFDGLNEISVRAFRRAAPGSDRIDASYTLTQLVRLGSREEDISGEQGELLEEAIRGAGEERR